MDNANLLLGNSALAVAIPLIWHEAELLDRKAYTEWLELWSIDGHYVVPIDPNAEDFAATLNYVYDDQEMREKRVQRMTSGYSASASDAARTVRTVSRFTSNGQHGDLIEVRSTQMVMAYKRGTTTLFGADLTHRLRLTDGRVRIVEKVVRLIEANEALSAIGFLL